MKCSLVSLIFLKRSLVFPILLFSSISLHWSLRKAFLSLLAILWNSAFKWVYLPSYPLPFTSLLFTAICKASSDSHFALLHFFFLGMVLITASYTISWTAAHSSSGTLSELIPSIYFSLPLYNYKGLALGHGEGNGSPLQYSCLGNSMDRGAWRATVHGVTKSQKTDLATKQQ